jgi:hypothetical protein
MGKGKERKEKERERMRTAGLAWGLPKEEKGHVRGCEMVRKGGDSV